MYQKLAREKFENTPRQYWLEELAKHIAPQAESPPFVIDVDLVANLPREARAIYFLSMFACEVDGNGIECMESGPWSWALKREVRAVFSQDRNLTKPCS